MRTADGGASWTAMRLGAGGDLCAVDFADPLHGVIVGEDGFVARTSDGGRTWRASRPLARRPYLGDVAFAGDGRVVLAVDRNGRILRSADAGATWSSVYTQATSLYQVSFADRTHGWAVGHHGVVVRTTDAGRSWSVVDGPEGCDLESVVALGPDEVLVGGTDADGDGVIVGTEDAGASWTVRAQVKPVVLDEEIVVDFGFADDRLHGWAVATRATLRTEDGGMTWHVQDSGLREQVSWAVAALTEDRAWIVASFGRMAQTADGGETWSHPTGPDNDPLAAIAMVDRRYGWVVGRGVRATEDGGRTWVPQDTGAPDSVVWYGADAVDRRRCWVVGEAVGGGRDKGVLYATDDGGRTWRPQIELTAPGLTAVDFVTPGWGYAVGRHGAILWTDDGGSSWQRQRSGIKSLLNAVSFATRARGAVVGDYGRLLTTFDGGRTWSSLRSGDRKDLNGVVMRGRVGLAVGDGGTILRTADGGRTWRRVRTRAGATADLLSVDLIDGRWGWAVGQAKPQRYSFKPALWMTSDGGRTWVARTLSLPVYCLFDAVDFVDRQTGWIVGLDTYSLFGADGIVLATTTGGR